MRTCERDAWSSDARRCATTDPEPTDCLVKLEPRQREQLIVDLAPWPEFAATLAERLGLVGDVASHSYVGCSEVVPEPAAYPPFVAAATASDRAWVNAQRAFEITRRCQDDRWSLDVKQCLHRATTTATTIACVGNLEPMQRSALAARLQRLNELLAVTVALRERPAAIECTAAVDVHYTDGAWHHELDGLPAAARAATIGRSRTLMLTACVLDAWTATLRACVVAGGGEVCFVAAGQAATWTYPALGSLTTGVAECDAYTRAVVAASGCAALPAAIRDDARHAFRDDAERWGEMTDGERAGEAENCKVRRFDIERVTAAACPSAAHRHP